MPSKKPPVSSLVDVHVRLFTEDVAYLKQLALETGVPWQVELRVRVRKFCKHEPQDVIILKEKP